MNLFKSIEKSFLIVCCVVAFVGLLVIIWPSAIMKLICWLLALALIAVGVLRIMTYTKESKTLTDSKIPNLALGAFLVVAGIIIAFTSDALVLLIPLVLALAIWFGALYLVQETWEQFKVKKDNWWITGIMAVVALVLAIIVTVKLEDNMAFLIADQLGDFFGMEVPNSMWLTGLSLILVPAEILASKIVADLPSAK